MPLARQLCNIVGTMQGAELARWCEDGGKRANPKGIQEKKKMIEADASLEEPK